MTNVCIDCEFEMIQGAEDHNCFKELEIRLKTHFEERFRKADTNFDILFDKAAKIGRYFNREKLGGDLRDSFLGFEGSQKY